MNEKTTTPLISSHSWKASVLESAELHSAPSSLITGDGDYPPPSNFQAAKYIFFVESTKLWIIGGPIAFNILCNYGVNSVTNIFAGHIGDIELSSVAISLSVIANFSFGFLVYYLFPVSNHLIMPVY